MKKNCCSETVNVEHRCKVNFNVALKLNDRLGYHKSAIDNEHNKSSSEICLAFHLDEKLNNYYVLSRDADLVLFETAKCLSHKIGKVLQLSTLRIFTVSFSVAEEKQTTLPLNHRNDSNVSKNSSALGSQFNLFASISWKHRSQCT